MHLLFDIFQGIGIAAAAGIRPFLPGLAAGLLAVGGVEIHFDHTKFHFLQAAPFLIIVGVLALVLIVVEASRRGAQVDSSSTGWGVAACGAAVGALFFGASLCRSGHHPWWPGLVGGVICAAVGVLAARPFLTRLRSRLDAEAAAVGVPLIAEGSALLIAVLSVVAPPVGVVALIGLVVLILRGRGRDDQKYAGLRILR